MSSPAGVYLIIFGLVFGLAFSTFMVAPIWLLVAVLVLGVPVLFWWIRRW